MKYMGSKRRIIKDILPIILQDGTDGQFYVEPFVGGCNSIEHVMGNRIGNDIHRELIAMWRALQVGWLPPEFISEDDYYRIKREGTPEEKGYVGFSLSFGGKYWGGYRRDVKGQKGSIENMRVQSDRACREILRQVPLIQGVQFESMDYSILPIPENSIVYCDIPYQSTTKYKGDSFDYPKFWRWVRDRTSEGHKVFVSEYTAPPDFKCVWSKEVTTGLDVSKTKKDVEKLFTL